MALSFPLLVGALFVIPFLLYVTQAVYNLYFHPLRSLPGPKSWIALPLLRNISACLGLYDRRMRDFHNRYGNVVRYGPSQVSFISAEAWKDIYGHGHRQLPKDITKDVSKTPDILNAGDADHAKFRKALSHGFSERSLRAQEPLIKGYVDLLIKKLQDLVASNQPIDMVKWYNLTTFDIIGDLAFGESFGGLETSTYHFWVKNMFNALKLIPFINLAQSYPLVSRAFNIMMPNSVQDKADEQRRFAREKAMKRMHRTGGNYRHDFMDSMLKHRGDKDGLSDDEIVSNSNVLIIAGSETTATLLSGVTYWLLRTPEVLEKVTQEVRSSFDTEDEITFTTTSSKLPYMTACLTEALRMYPPVPSNLPRRTPRDAVTCIAGINIPPGTSVSVHHSAAYWSPINFHQPRSFSPERWLPPAKTDSSSPFYHDNRAVVQPFSVGPRNCIGRNLADNEMRVILARVLWDFDLELSDESLHWEDQNSYLLWEKSELWCLLKRRREQKEVA